MKRFLTILEGPGKGSEKPLDKDYMLVGRSHVADVQIEGDDLAVSRRHLEIRIKDGEVFVKDISSKGSLLNGQRLKGEVSLNRGDVLDLGQSKLRYEEVDGEEAPADQTRSRPEAPLADDRTRAPGDRTRVADDRTRMADDRTRLAGSGSAAQAAREADPDATHAAMEDQTRMLNQAELPGWKSPTKQRSGLRVTLLISALAILLVAAGGIFWFLKDDSASAGGESTEFKDPGAGFSVKVPVAWSRTAGKPDMVSFGEGKEGQDEWARANVYFDKNPQYSITGLKSGFADYKEVLKKHFPNIDFKGSERRTVNDIELVFFGFNSSGLEGVGIYTLNGDTRIAIECVGPSQSHQRYASDFESIFKSLRFTSGEPQQCIDFPLPDANMKRLALASPAELSREVQEHEKRAEGLMANKDVRPDNLYRSVQEYGQALQLAVAGPQPLPAYPTLARGLWRAKQLYVQAVERQKFEVSRALKGKDTTAAYWAANRLMQMVPDKTSPTHQQAYKIFKSLDPTK